MAEALLGNSSRRHWIIYCLQSTWTKGSTTSIASILGRPPQLSKLTFLTLIYKCWGIGEVTPTSIIYDYIKTPPHELAKLSKHITDGYPFPSMKQFQAVSAGIQPYLDIFRQLVSLCIKMYSCTCLSTLLISLVYLMVYKKIKKIIVQNPLSYSLILGTMSMSWETMVG